MGLSCVALVNRANLQACFTTQKSKKMRAESIKEFVPDLPVFQVKIGGRFRYYQCSSRVELSIYFQTYYPRIECFISEELPLFILHMLPEPYFLLTCN